MDMDVGLFVSYEIAADSLTTKLFRFITLKSVPLKTVKEFRVADDASITPLNRVNWFNFRSKRQNLCPVYTLQTTEKSPRIFMRLDEGSHMIMKKTLEQIDA